MRIGLIDVDSKIPNLALMKISAWHKQQGDIVKWWNAFEAFDHVYASKVFTHTKASYVPKNAIKGGSGYSLETTLSDEIEHIYPDYSLYGIDYAMGYITRGCINACPFCIVRKKEGTLRKVDCLEEFWKDQDHITLLDNAITDCDEALIELEKIRDKKIRLKLQSGFNIRTITKEKAELLSQIRLWGYTNGSYSETGGQWYIAWDNPLEKERVLKGISICQDAGISPSKFLCYILVNYNSTLEQDLERIMLLDRLGVDPFVMIYNRSTSDSIYSKLGRWCNRPQIRKSCSFNDYLKVKS